MAAFKGPIQRDEPRRIREQTRQRLHEDAVQKAQAFFTDQLSGTERLSLKHSLFADDETPLEEIFFYEALSYLWAYLLDLPEDQFEGLNCAPSVTEKIRETGTQKLKLYQNRALQIHKISGYQPHDVERLKALSMSHGLVEPRENLILPVIGHAPRALPERRQR